ncbi:MAG: aspartate kinase [Bacteroidales bacterium]|nr:aspartate kinase [Bacteroidales bacterium]MBR5671353.1 aspartate kinase [Bacteroidales bacterium]
MIIMKFGGTSVADATAMLRTISIVESKLAQKPVMVVSACAKVTDGLYNIISLAEACKQEEAADAIAALKARHMGIVDDINATLPEVNERKDRDVRNKINRIFATLEEHLGEGNMSECDKAVIISSGEYLSSTIIAYAMNMRGTKTHWVDARSMIITDEDFLKASPRMDILEVSAARVVKEAYAKYQTIITQGFISATEDGRPTLLGRGGSDYTASLIGMAIDADRIEIWTDVDGVRTADPRIVSNTKGLHKLSYEEATEMARFGAKVLHPLTLEPAQKKNIPVYVLNSMNPQNEGTAVLSRACVFDGIKTLSYKENIRVINIYSMKMINTVGFMEKVFKTFARHNVSVDLLSSSEASITVTVEASQNVEGAVKGLSTFADVTVDRDKAQISIIGKNIIGVRGLLASVFNAVIDSKIYMISQDTTYLNLSIVVDRPEMADVLKKLHQNLFEHGYFN